jgi:RNA polymerase sigma-70 factor (ECF subfamily)
VVEVATSASTAERERFDRAQAGDRQAFGELVEVHRQGVVNVVYRMCGDVQLAEESAQEAFIRAWQNIRRYDPRFAFRNWVYRIAINLALDVLRRTKQTTDIETEPLVSNSESPEAAAERSERAEAVRQAVLKLPPASRAVLILREYESLTYHEIAESLDIPVGTVMSRLNYARTQIRKELSSLLEAV